ncbi:MAG: hypothetical protein IJ493_08760 [Clostridia bacterium]|nr:hypothetical protein [Clostridia bacterium]
MFNLFKRKKDGSNGSITVMVTLIMVPTMVVTGFMVDLARLKLYGNQALMTADNYGEAVLSVYDNLLKDLYGLFAVSQSQKGIDALNALDDYISSSFNPNENAISWEHLSTWVPQTQYTGFMPYESAEVELSKANCSEANLANTQVLSTQIGDFMKFRIAQALMDDGSSLLEAVAQINSMEKNSEALETKSEFDEKAQNLLDEAQKYYNVLKEIKTYATFINNVSHARNNALSSINSLVNGSSYQRYKAYYSDKSNIDAAVKHSQNLKKDEKLTDDEIALIAIYNDWASDPNATKSQISSKFDSIIDTYKASLNASPVDFDNFDSKSSMLTYYAGRVADKYTTLQSKRRELEAELNDPNVSEELKVGMREELALIDDLFTVNGKFSAEHYTKTAKIVSDNARTNDELDKAASDNLDCFKDMKTAYLNLTAAPQPASTIKTDNYDNFYTYPNSKTLYDNLVKTFESGDDNGAKKKQKDAENMLSDAEKEISGEEKSDARDIPASLNMGTSGTAPSFRLTDMVGSAIDMFTNNDLAGVGNTLLLKLYTVQYDFSMFSNRTTNVEKKDNSGEAQEKAVSLTGYELSKKINYLYKAELEYIFGGYNDSDQNLASARNHILAFRAVVNLTATYTVKEIHNAIQEISKLAAAVNPALGIAVAAALRLAVAGIETAQDWKVLKEGEGVVLIKTDLNDLTAYDRFKDLIEAEESPSGESKHFKMDYEQYLMVMLVFMTTAEQVASRTGDLISLNVNTVDQNIGEKGTLSKLTFKMENAVTAVDATCKVHLDFLVMPESMAQMLLGDEYSKVETYSQNKYGFTVTRGY